MNLHRTGYRPRGWRERLGQLGGALMAPAVAFGARLRRARLFHPEGTCYVAAVEPLGTAGVYATAAERLAGQALVRLSTAWWRGGREWPDALGCALRFRRGDPTDPGPHADDQDLLLATIPRPWLTPFAPLWTRRHDFLENVYYAVSPFRLPGGARVRLRLVPLVEPCRHDGLDRGQRLARAVSRGAATLRLEAARVRRPAAWAPIVDVHLRAPLDLDQEALRFSPFQAGRGLRPSGFVHALRLVTYAASQRVRPAHGEGRA